MLLMWYCLEFVAFPTVSCSGSLTVVSLTPDVIKPTSCAFFHDIHRRCVYMHLIYSVSLVSPCATHDPHSLVIELNGPTAMVCTAGPGRGKEPKKYALARIEMCFNVCPRSADLL